MTIFFFSIAGGVRRWTVSRRRRSTTPLMLSWLLSTRPIFSCNKPEKALIFTVFLKKRTPLSSTTTLLPRVEEAALCRNTTFPMTFKKFLTSGYTRSN